MIPDQLYCFPFFRPTVQFSMNLTINRIQKIVVFLQFVVCIFVLITRVALTRSAGPPKRSPSGPSSSTSTTTATSTMATHGGGEGNRRQKRCCCLHVSCCCVKCCVEDCCCSSTLCLALCCADAQCDGILLYYLLYMISMILSISNLQIGYVVQWVALLDVMIRNETARNVLAAVTTPAKQLAVASFLSMIFGYFFALIGFFFFNNDFELGE